LEVNNNIFKENAMKYLNLNNFLPQLFIVLMISSLIACGSHHSGSHRGSSGGDTSNEQIVSEDICNSDTGQSDILSVAANRVKIHWNDDDNYCSSDSDYTHHSYYDHYHHKDGHDDDDLAKVTINGELSLQCTDYTQLTPMLTASVSISSSAIIDESIEFQVLDDGNTWEYKNDSVDTGLKKFRIEWKGPGFEYDGEINMKAVFIGYDKTVIKIDPKDVTTAFAVDIGAATIEVDENGHVNAFPDSYIGLTKTGKDGTIIAELLFELSRDMSIFIHQGGETSEISVAPYYRTSWGKFKIKGFFDPAGFEGIKQSADVTFSIIVGNIELTGSATIEDNEWDRSDGTWRYPSRD
jgi:hypothetical protein